MAGGAGAADACARADATLGDALATGSGPVARDRQRMPVVAPSTASSASPAPATSRVGRPPPGAALPCTDAYDVFGVCHEGPVGLVLGPSWTAPGGMLPESATAPAGGGTEPRGTPRGGCEGWCAGGGRSLRTTGSALVASGSMIWAGTSGVGSRTSDSPSSGSASRSSRTTSSNDCARFLISVSRHARTTARRAAGTCGAHSSMLFGLVVAILTMSALKFLASYAR